MADLKQAFPASQHDAMTYWQGATPHSLSARRLIWLSVFGLVVFILICLFTWRTVSGQFEELNRQRAGVLHSRDVLNVITAVRERLQQGLTGARLYAETGNKDFLLAYTAALREFPGQITQLQVLVNTAAGQDAIAQLAQMGNTSLDYAATLIAAHDNGKLDAAEQERMIRANGVNVMTIRRALEAWRTREVATLISSDKRTEQQLLDARRYVYGVLIVGALVIAALSWLLLRYVWRREQMEQRLRRVSELWSGTLASLSEGVGLYSMDRRLWLWNPRFAEVHGVPADKLYAGIDFAEVIRQSANLKDRSIESAIASAAQTADLLRAGGVQDVERERSDGTILRITANAMGNDYYVVTLSDITSIRRSEQLAQDRAIRLGAVMDNVPDAIVTINASGSIESWSAGAQRMFGYAAETVLRRHVNLLFAEPQTDGHDSYVQRCLNDNEPDLMMKRTELMARRQDDQIFPVELRVSEIHIDGRRILVGIMRDITEQRAVERMKDEFVATVSHELRTPLTSIAGSLALLTGGVGGAIPAKAQHLLEIANRNSQRLTVLINDILELEKADLGRMSLQLHAQPLLPVLQQALEVNRAYAQQFQVSFALRSEAVEPMVLVDEARLMQVLTNLLSNAVKFSPPGGLVLITVELRSDQVRVTIHDDGPGIPENFRNRIFTRFAQADNSNTRRSGGTGLGLAISKSLIEHHGGQIGFDSGHSAVGSGQGASFWFQLQTITAVTAPVTAEIPVTNLADTRILICDDDPDIAELLVGLLRQHGCIVAVAHSAAAALEMVSLQRPDLLLVDVNLPDEDGLTLIAQLREQAELQDVAVMILSAVDCAKLDAKLLATLGVKGCLRKPVNATALPAAVLRTLAGR